MAHSNTTPDSTTPKTHGEETLEIEKVDSFDTIHQDEAVKVLGTYGGGQTWTKEEESKLRRKIDWRLMPVLCLTYGMQYYDKAMLGQAVS